MSRQKVAVVVGTRPEIIKMQPIVKEIKKRGLDFSFIHTGQHYDCNMSNSFIRELELPEPDAFLNVGSGSQGVQIARIITRSESALKESKPDIVLVEGDTNSALGASLAAARLNIPIGHVEAGCRSFDRTMPEELNRILIADIASLHFAPTDTCAQNLRHEGIPEEHIYCLGHPIVDLIDQAEAKIKLATIKKFNLEPEQYYLVTIHRTENTENRPILEDMLSALSMLAQSHVVFFPIHPRTRRAITRFGLGKCLQNLRVSAPVSYFESLSLIKHAGITLTDSGGIQQETAILGTPCITMRNTTEWVETVSCGVNFLARSKEEILAIEKKLQKEHKVKMPNRNLARTIFGVPGVSAKILDVIQGSRLGGPHCTYAL